MNGCKTGPGGKGHMQGRDVAEANQQLRIGADQVVVQIRKNARAPPSPAHSEDGTHAVVPIHRIDVGGARFILASEIAITRKEVRSGFGTLPNTGHGLPNDLEINCLLVETARPAKANLYTH